MKNLFTFDIEFLKNHQTTKGYCNVYVEAERILNADTVLPQIKHMIKTTYSDLPHLRIYRYTNHFTECRTQPADTILIGVLNVDETAETMVRGIKAD